MVSAIQTETQHKDHKDLGLFILVLMSHGNINQVYGTDLKPVDLKVIWDLLSSTSFPHMAGKPKVIIVQACSGGREYHWKTFQRCAVTVQWKL